MERIVAGHSLPADDLHRPIVKKNTKTNMDWKVLNMVAVCDDLADIIENKISLSARKHIYYSPFTYFSMYINFNKPPEAL